MNTSARLIALMLVALVVALPSAALAAEPSVLATEEPGDEVVEEPQFEEGEAPAEIAPAEAEDDAEQPWTARFLAPTVLALGLGAFVASVAYYGVRVRGRYEVVD